MPTKGFEPTSPKISTHILKPIFHAPTPPKMAKSAKWPFSARRPKEIASKPKRWPAFLLSRGPISGIIRKLCENPLEKSPTPPSLCAKSKK